MERFSCRSAMIYLFEKKLVSGASNRLFILEIDPFVHKVGLKRAARYILGQSCVIWYKQIFS